MVELADGARTTTGSPHLEIFVVTFTPSAAVEVSAMGRFALVAERLSVFDNFGVLPVAAVVHLRTYRSSPLLALVLTVVPLALGNNDVSEATVTSDLRLVYSLVAGFQASHFVPTIFACVALIPNSDVRPVELPLMYPPVGVTLTDNTAAPSVSFSVPLFVPTSATIFSFSADEGETAENVMCALDWAATADPADLSTEPAVLSTEPASAASPPAGRAMSVDAAKPARPRGSAKKKAGTIREGSGICFKLVSAGAFSGSPPRHADIGSILRDIRRSP